MPCPAGVFACFSAAALLSPRRSYLYLGGLLSSVLTTFMWCAALRCGVLRMQGCAHVKFCGREAQLVCSARGPAGLHFLLYMCGSQPCKPGAGQAPLALCASPSLTPHPHRTPAFHLRPRRMRLATFVFGGGALLYQAELYIGLAVFSGYVVYDTQVTGWIGKWVQC